MSTSFPYREGDTILLEIDTETDQETDDPFSFHGSIQCKIQKHYQPSTLSCVMEVEIEKGSYAGQRFALKLYDHRYSKKLRADYAMESFGPTQEKAYLDFVKNGDASEFLALLRGDDRFEEPEGEPWTDLQNGIYLVFWCVQMYRSECAAYDRLKDLQGKEIPQLFAKVRLPAAPPFAADLQGEFYEIKGILLEFIDGFTLGELPFNAPQYHWQEICDEALRIVELCNDRNILNRDVRPGNVMVAPLRSGDNAYRVVMLDFALSRLRSPEDSDLKWGRNKWSVDEEGSIGEVMQLELKEFGFNLKYQHSYRYMEWGCKEGDEDPMLW